MSQLVLDCLPDGGTSFSVLPESLDQIEKAIETVFRVGGSVRLENVEPLPDGKSRRPLQAIAIEGEPGRCRILVTLTFEDDGSVRSWWDGGVPRGAEVFVYDDVTDRRNICDDVTIAKNLFKEFFLNKGVSQRLIDVTR